MSLLCPLYFKSEGVVGTSHCSSGKALSHRYVCSSGKEKIRLDNYVITVWDVTKGIPAALPARFSVPNKNSHYMLFPKNNVQKRVLKGKIKYVLASKFTILLCLNNWF